MKTDPTARPDSGGTLKVLMVVGVGRSGSTMLDIVLGNHPEIESVGELTNVARLGWINDEYCACGRRVGTCPYWNDVRRRLESEVGAFDPETYLRLQRRFERIRQLWRIPFERRGPSRDFLLYERQTLAIYEAVRQTAGRPIIVDSSKNPVRALALSLVPELDVHVLHLVRSAGGVTWSLKKPYRRDDAGGVQRDMPSRPAWRTALVWTRGNALAELVARRFPPNRRAFLTYEAFVEDPVGSIQRIGRLLGVDLSELGHRVAKGEPMAAGHTIAGNRVRMRGSVRLQPDVEWRDRLSPSDRITVKTITGPLMSHYGYRQE